MSTSAPISAPAAAAGTGARPPHRRWPDWLMVVAIVAVPVAPLAVVAWWPGETTRWRAAIAIEHYLEGDLDGAARRVDQALEQDPRAAALYELRGLILTDAQQTDQALADFDRALELAPHNLRVRMAKVTALAEAGRFGPAAALVEQILPGGEGSALVLNYVAYMRALAKVKLDDSLRQAERAVQLTNGAPEVLDTRGYLYFLLGRNDEARPDLDRAVNDFEARYEQLLTRLKAGWYYDLRLEVRTRRELAKGVAVVRYHRALLCRAAGDLTQALADEDRVRELGFTPNDRLF